MSTNHRRGLIGAGLVFWPLIAWVAWFWGFAAAGRVTFYTVGALVTIVLVVTGFQLMDAAVEKAKR